MIHIDKGGNKETTKWLLDHLAQYYVPFNALGQSFYPWRHGGLDDRKDNLAFTWNTYHKDVVVAETAYDWRTGEDFKGKAEPFPQTPEGQRDFLAALNRVVVRRRAVRCGHLLVGTDGGRGEPCSTTNIRRCRRSMFSRGRPTRKGSCRGLDETLMPQGLGLGSPAFHYRAGSHESAGRLLESVRLKGSRTFKLWGRV